VHGTLVANYWSNQDTNECCVVTCASALLRSRSQQMDSKGAHSRPSARLALRRLV